MLAPLLATLPSLRLMFCVADAGLSQALRDELDYEQGQAAETSSEGKPAWLAELEETWTVRASLDCRRVYADCRCCFGQIENKSGEDEVKLTKRFGNEEYGTYRFVIRTMS